MKNVIIETIKKINSQNIKPDPRWKYLIKKYLKWLIFFVIVIMGAISLSVTYDILTQLDWDLYRFMHQSPLVYSLSLLPYLWLVLIAIFFGVSFFDLRKTENGYKYSWIKMSFIAASSVIFFGFIFSVIGFGGIFNRMIAKDIPYYGQHMITTKQNQWMQPQSGLLAGTIISVSENKIFLNDLNGKNWQINTNEKTLIRPRAQIAQGEMIKIIGSQGDRNNFQAIEVRPWIGMGMTKGQNQRQDNRMMNFGGSGMLR